MKKKIAISIHFDSFSECLKLTNSTPIAFRDPCYFEVMSRFFKIAAEYQAHFTINVIGRELENPAYSDAVASWHEMGHEIGNHTYSHRQDFVRLSSDQIRFEIERAHELIQKATGVPPVGFVSPSWTSSEKYLGILSRLNYLYDASLAPSWLLLFMNFLLRFRSPGAKEMIPWIRTDWEKNLFGKRDAHYLHFEKSELSGDVGLYPVQDSIIQMPLPTAFPFRIPLWHTIGLILPDWAHRLLIQYANRNSDYFCYIFHPTDFVDASRDLQGLPTAIHGIVRMDTPFSIKERKLRLVFEELAGLGELVRVKDLAADFHSMSSLAPACSSDAVSGLYPNSTVSKDW